MTDADQQLWNMTASATYKLKESILCICTLGCCWFNTDYCCCCCCCWCLELSAHLASVCINPFKSLCACWMALGTVHPHVVTWRRCSGIILPETHRYMVQASLAHWQMLTSRCGIWTTSTPFLTALATYEFHQIRYNRIIIGLHVKRYLRLGLSLPTLKNVLQWVASIKQIGVLPFVRLHIARMLCFATFR